MQLYTFSRHRISSSKNSPTLRNSNIHILTSLYSRDFFIRIKHVSMTLEQHLVRTRSRGEKLGSGKMEDKNSVTSLTRRKNGERLAWRSTIAARDIVFLPRHELRNKITTRNWNYPRITIARGWSYPGVCIDTRRWRGVAALMAAKHA